MVYFGIPLRYWLIGAGFLAVLALAIIALHYRLDEGLLEASRESDIEREDIQTAIVGVVILLAALGIVYWGLTALPTLLFLLYGLLFLAGFAIVPILAFTIGPGLGSFVPEMISNLLWILSMAGVRRGFLEQQETDEYRIDRAPAGIKPRSYWTRWALIPFGITFEATEQAFQPTVASDELKDKVDRIGVTDGGEPAAGAYVDDGPGALATIGLSRGGKHTRWFATSDDRGKILVPLGQKLAELKNAAGLDFSVEAYNNALAKYGGDTAGTTNRLRLVGSFLFVTLGMGMGYVVFF